MSRRNVYFKDFNRNWLFSMQAWPTISTSGGIDCAIMQTIPLLSVKTGPNVS